MHYLPLLGQPLKSDDLIDLLETHDIDVTYDFDRNHENIPDAYWASAHDLGMQLKFDENQVLRTVFLFLTELDGYSPADLAESDIMLFGSKQDIRDYATKNQIHTTEGAGDFLGTKHDWIRLDFPDYAIHYDFGDGPLKKVSLNLTKKSDEQAAS